MMIRFAKLMVFTLMLVGLLSGCAGYRLGSVGGKDLQGINTIFVPTVKNLSYEPGLDVVTSNAILRALDNDGTLKTTQSDDADSELDVTISSIERENIRGNSLDSQATEEYQIYLNAQVTFINKKLGKKVLDNVKIQGSAKYFVQSDQTESERQVLPMAAEDLAKNIVSQVVEGW